MQISDLVKKYADESEKNVIRAIQPGASRICAFFSMAKIPFVFVPFENDPANPLATQYHTIIALADSKEWMPIMSLAIEMNGEAVVKTVLDSMNALSVIEAAKVTRLRENQS